MSVVFEFFSRDLVFEPAKETKRIWKGETYSALEPVRPFAFVWDDEKSMDYYELEEGPECA